MIADLKPYPAMKESGVPWLGEVPKHWDTSKIKGLARPGYKTFVDGDWIESPYITADGIRLIQTGNIGTGEYREKGFRYISEETFTNFGCTEIKPGDVLICRLGEPVARACLAPQLGNRMITSVDVCILKTRENIHAKFLVYSMSSWPYLDWVGSLVRGSTRDRVSRSMLGSFLLPFSPLPEQAAIVRYLDHVDRRIRRYIRAKQKLIKLLEEQKQALIHQIVTRGLDPNVRLKPSGVEWLGDVPEHWEVVALRYVATKFGSGVTPRGGATMYEVTGIPFLRSQNIHFDGIHLEGVVRIPQDLHDTLAGTHVKPGDVLLNITGASIGRVCSVPDNFEEGNVNQHVCIIRPKRRRVLPGFLAAFLSTPFMQREIRFEQNGASREGLTLHSIRGFKVALPTAAEQQHILDEIRGQTGQLAVATATAQGEVDLLREYRTRLIADVVTGKLDVREAAARLPDEDEEPEPLDETDTLINGKEEPSGGLDATPEEAAV